MTIKRTINGYWLIADIVEGYRRQRCYMGYTKRQAVALFRAERTKR